MTNETTIKCPICGEPYKVYSDLEIDQSACPDCIRIAESKARGEYHKPTL